MDAKDLRTESALSERNNDSSKYSQSGSITLQCERNKSYQDVGSNSVPKVDVSGARPCAVIGPDRVVPPTVSNESYLKKSPSEPWSCMDNAYHHTKRPPEYPNKLVNFQNPTRNISPRQTYQENMQRIMVPPSYNSVKISDDSNYTQITEKSNVLPKNVKINVPSEAKFCDVPYTVYPTSNEHKSIRNVDMSISSVNPTLPRTAPHGWPPGNVNVRPTRTYGAPELYQFQDYSNCGVPRQMVPRPNRTGPEDPGYVYADPYYHQEANIRYKPYPTAKERFPQQRYDYVSNYANSFHSQPAFPSHKYDMQRPIPPHPYPPYPPIKYLERVTDPAMEGYQRNQQGNFNIAYRNQIIHPNFGPVLNTCHQNKIHGYPSDSHLKTISPSKLPYENAKAYVEYENGRPKMYPTTESYFVNEMGRMHPMKNQVIMSNYPSINMHNVSPTQYYKKENQHIKNYEYMQAHFRSMDPNLNLHNPMARHPSNFSPNTLAISPSDSSSTSNDTSLTLGTSQEDCGYVSQSSTASVRSIDSGMNRIPNEYMRRYYDNRFGPIIRTSPMILKSELNHNNSSKEKKNINVRQFLQMWNEGDEESEENIPKEIIIQTGPKSDGNFNKFHEGISQVNQEQLYVLGLVNVPSEELGKYEHIQKISKLPENIKGYNHIELLNQFEEAIESSNMTNYKTSSTKDFQMPPQAFPPKPCSVEPRPLSPLDVEAKISQSVIHKEVGCNFEIKPCSPKMLNVEVATPVQNVLTERIIEKVANPVMLKSPRLNGVDESIDCNLMKRKDHRLNINNDSIRIPSCKMVNTQYSNNNAMDTIKNSYSLQDLESNSGLCLASLPRLDNDMELNFPEVNQQFINANRRDSTILTTALRDLPTLEVLEQTDSQTKLHDVNSVTCDRDDIKSPCVLDSEKEVSKLSKYRKTRAHLSDAKDNLHAIRTDSVIIKNPENVKNSEEASIFSPNSLIKQVNDIQQAPINLTSQGIIVESDSVVFATKKEDIGKEIDSSIGIAIDFSLNRNTCNDNIECLDGKIDKETNILAQSMSETSKSLLNKEISEVPTLSDCQQNIPHDSINLGDVDQNIEEDNDRQTMMEIINRKDDNTLKDNTTLKETYMKNDYVSSITSVNGDKEEYLPNACIKEVNEDSSNSMIDFVTPTAELLTTSKRNNDDYLMNIDNKDGVAISNLNNTNNILARPKGIVKVLSKHDQKLHNENNSDQKDSEEIDMQHAITQSSDEFHQLFKVSDITDTKSPNPESININDQKLTLPQDLSDINNFNSNNIEQNTNSNFDLELMNRISLPSENIPNIDEDNSNFDLLAPNSPVNYPTETSKLKLLSSVLEKSEIQTECLSERTDRDFFTNFSIPSPVVNNRDDSSEVAVDDSDFKLIALDSAEITNQGDASTRLIESERVSYSTLLFENNRHKYVESKCDLLSLSNSELQGRSINELNNMIVSTDGLVQDEKNEQKDDIITDDKLNDHDMEEKLKAQCTHDKVLRYDQDKRYLYYGSKEMYSPWIQKLIINCVGNISNIGIDYKHSTCIPIKLERKAEGSSSPVPTKDCNLTLREEETYQIGILDSCLENDNLREHEINNEDSYRSPVISNNSNCKLTGENRDQINMLGRLDNFMEQDNATEHKKDRTIGSTSPVTSNNSNCKLTEGTQIEDSNNSDSYLKNDNTNEHQINLKDTTISPDCTVTEEKINETGILGRLERCQEQDNATEITNCGTEDSASAVALHNSGIILTECNRIDILANFDSSIEEDKVNVHRRSTEDGFTFDDFKVTEDTDQKVVLNCFNSCPEHDNATEHEKFTTESSLSPVISQSSLENDDVHELETNVLEVAESPDCTIKKEETDRIDVIDRFNRCLEPETLERDRRESSTSPLNSEKSNSNEHKRDKTEGSSSPVPTNINLTLIEEETDQIGTIDRIDCCLEQYITSKTDYSTSPVIDELNFDDSSVIDYQSENDSLHDNNQYITESNNSHITNIELNSEEKSSTSSKEINYGKLIAASEGSINMSDSVEDLKNDCDQIDKSSIPGQASCCLQGEIHEYNQVNDNKVVPVNSLCDKSHEYNIELSEQQDKHSNSGDKMSEQCVIQSKYNNELFISNTKTHGKCDNELYLNDQMTQHCDNCDKQSNCNVEVYQEQVEQPYNEVHNCDTELDERKEKSDQRLKTCDHDESVVEPFDRPSSGNIEDVVDSDKQSHCNDLEVELCVAEEKSELHFTKFQSPKHIFLNTNRQSLKRSLSDSALNIYENNEPDQQSVNEERIQLIWPIKRRKMNVDNDLLAENLCNIIQSNRRNSISSIYNEENLSFCILIDNDCIITEEENDEQEKICYTNLSEEECLTEVQSGFSQDEVNSQILSEIISTPEYKNDCEYNDAYKTQDEDENIEDSWVEDVACVETVISDDIAEDIELSGPTSPKQNVFSENNESEIFSCSEHTDKVKYIYGDKMCNDDAQFVETLYNTPQMDVNKKLIQREPLNSGGYYDDDSLEKILSECNVPKKPYVPEKIEPLFSPSLINIRQNTDNKDNAVTEILAPLESIVNTLDVIDMEIVKTDESNVKFNHFVKTQDDTIHSCESSVDNVLTYQESDDNVKYKSSSSPEVSSTTSEEKSSSILLKITNYKGSRVSQINETIRDDKRPSCKFTENIHYDQSHSNFPTHRPLLTKAAQKYIPPLKESIRDLKVRLSLPQHSLIKLKQLKKSKDKPKLNTQNVSVPTITKKPKPKFEDVLKSIDEIQFQMHKEKTKKAKKFIPKVVIKKNENGSHYASTSDKNEFNPDLTGRKWQPWVFIEKNHFIDKMALKKKTKAIYNHRKQTYVFAEKFQKYKSVSSAKFVISPPLSSCPSTGLKYTIRLKHNY